jgi:hypothetical protein
MTYPETARYRNGGIDQQVGTDGKQCNSESQASQSSQRLQGIVTVPPVASYCQRQAGLDPMEAADGDHDSQVDGQARQENRSIDAIESEVPTDESEEQKRGQDQGRAIAPDEHASRGDRPDDRYGTEDEAQIEDVRSDNVAHGDVRVLFESGDQGNT